MKSEMFCVIVHSLERIIFMRENLSRQKRVISKKLGDEYIKGNESMASSQSPYNQLLSTLRYLGQVEQEGDTGIKFLFLKKVCVAVARINNWTPDQIEKAFQEGQMFAKLSRAATEWEVFAEELK